MNKPDRNNIPCEVARILAVTIGGLGDAILFSPVLKALRVRYTNAETHLLVANPLTQEAYGICQEVDKTTLLPDNGRNKVRQTFEFIRFGIKCRLKGGIDIGVFATGLNPKLVALMKITGGIKNIFLAPSPPDYPTDFLCNLSLASIFYKDTSEDDAFFPTYPESFQDARNTLSKYNISLDNDNLIIVYPSSELPHRPRLELEKLVMTCQLIKENGFQGKILVVGTASEGIEWCQSDTNNIIDANLAGKLSISGVAAILTKASLAIGNDGGVMHVAGAVNCPSVVILANTPLSYRPPGSNVKAIHSRLSCCNGLYPKRPRSCRVAKCVEDITTEEIYKGCSKFLF